jgi:quercetin dioxygenase-like cupin family protein
MKRGHMKSIHLGNSPQPQSTRGRRSRNILLLFALGLAVAALATPPLGFVVNQILAMGTALDNISQQVQIASGGDGDQQWQLQLQAQGATDFYVQQLELAPGGYSGWHTHPGILIGTVVSGAIDFYDANCQKYSFTSGQVFTENSQVHGIINTGSVDAQLSIAYLVKHNAPRRIEADPPACAAATGIP